jgi:putative ABC transport system permease protein
MSRFPGLHRPSIRGRAWADRGPLLLTGAVITLTTLLASAVPVLMPRTGDDAVRDAVHEAGRFGAVVVTAPIVPEADLEGNRIRPGRTAEILTDTMENAKLPLGTELEAAMQPPIGTVTTNDLVLNGFGPGRIIRLAYVTGRAGAPQVTWTQGEPPKSAVPEEEANSAIRKPDQEWPVQVGLSEATAAELKIGAGARINAQDGEKAGLDVRVSGIFRPIDPNDPAWQAAPKLLRPLIGADGTGTRIETAALLSADSLPDGRLAVPETEVDRVITFAPHPARLGWKTSESLAAAVVKLKAGSGSFGDDSSEFRWESGLDSVLTQARAQVLAAAEQASVLLVGLIGAAALVLLLAADLLVRRRALVLASVRMRGASLAGIGAELLIESIAVTAVGVALGLLASQLLAGGYTWLWLLPAIAVAVLGGPVLGTRAAARATQGRQAPANRSARQTARRTGQLRRLAMELAVVLIAAGAFAALHQRGVVSATPDDAGGNLLSAVAPTLGAITGALILLRLIPLAVRLALNRAARYRGSLPLFAAARAAATAARPLPLIVLVVSCALLTFSLSLAATARTGQEQESWRNVGADARLDTNAAVPALARKIAAEDGVSQVVSARVTDNVTLQSAASTTFVRLVLVDPAAFERLLEATPLPDTPQLDQLKGQVGSRMPALLSTTDGFARSGSDLTLQWRQKPIPVTEVGPAPPVGAGDGNVMIVNAAAFAAIGLEAAPNTVWVLGPRARAATIDVVGADAAGQVTGRSEVLATQREAPLPDGLFRLALASIAVLLLFGLLSVGLGAAGGAPARGEMLARLRTLGLQPGQARRVALGELLPPVVVGALGGLLIGVILARASLGRLALRLITGQATDPTLVVPWVSLVPVLLLGVAVAVVVGVESSLRRRERLGQILRAGNQ